MSKIINTSEAPDKVKLPARVKIVAAIALIVLAGIGFFAFSPSLRKAASESYADIVDPPQGVCGKDRALISSYNQAAKGKDFKKVAEIGKTVRQKADYKSDPTCLYMSVVGYVANTDSRSGFADYDALMNLVQAGKTPSRRIDDGINKNDLYGSMKKLESEKPENPHGEG
jgi:hypothetical protein